MTIKVRHMTMNKKEYNNGIGSTSTKYQVSRRRGGGILFFLNKININLFLFNCTGADTGFQSGGPDFLETQKSLHMGKFFEVF